MWDIGIMIVGIVVAIVVLVSVPARPSAEDRRRAAEDDAERDENNRLRVTFEGWFE